MGGGQSPGDADGSEGSSNGDGSTASGGEDGDAGDPEESGDEGDSTEGDVPGDAEEPADDQERGDPGEGEDEDQEEGDNANEGDEPQDPDVPEDSGADDNANEGDDPDVPDDTGTAGDPEGPGDADTSGEGQLVEQTETIEPDDYADGTELTLVSALMSLSTALDDNSVVALFEVTASEDGQGLAPTGEQVFGHAGIPFFNDNRRLRMDFVSHASAIHVVFGGGTFHATEIGRLQAFDESGELLAEYSTALLGAGESETMTLTREAADIAWAVAYAEGDGAFGRLDELTVTVLAAP
jgi:hypothetical protein